MSQIKKMDGNWSVHESAYVDERVEVGAGTKVWHFVHILQGSRIGKNCSLGQNVMVGPDVTIGNDCKIQNNVAIYKGVVLEDGVFCGPSMVFTNVTTPRSEVNRRDEYVTTTVRKGATIGANATIVCGHELGKYCFIAAGAVVTKDVKPHAVMAGVPAKQIGWASYAGEMLRPSENGKLICLRTKAEFEVINDNLVCISP
jgi:UDP-2-acetamido-3-amino-2,3-dideoxy-glucuronate N-acetyltransferase